MNHSFAVVGFQHSHVTQFVESMLKLGHECIGIYDAKPEVMAAAYAEKNNIPLVLDVEEIWNSTATIIATSAINDEKISIVEKCNRFNKHIMVDKPIVTNREGLNRLEQVMKDGRIQIGLMLTSREKRSLNTLKHMITAGELGLIVSITSRKPHKLVPSSRQSWHFSKAQNGGIIHDLFIHDFDIVSWLTGQSFVSSSATVVKNILPEYPDFYDTAVVQSVLSGGTVVQLYTDWHTPEKLWSFGDLRLFITGTKGSVELRLTGDPSVAMEDLMFMVTHEEGFKKIPIESITFSLTEDFLNRFEGRSHEVTHHAIFEACRVAVDADEAAVIITK